MALQDVELHNPLDFEAEQPESSPAPSSSAAADSGLPDRESSAPTDEGVVGQKPAGDIEKAKSKVGTTIKQLEPMIATFGGETEEGKAIRKALEALYKGFPNMGQGDLTPTETANAVQDLPSEDKSIMAEELLTAAQPVSDDVNEQLGQAAAEPQEINPELLNQLGG